MHTFQGYKSKRAFIIAQSPMENTVRDFWKMVTYNKVPAIVMLLDAPEEDEVYRLDLDHISLIQTSQIDHVYAFQTEPCLLFPDNL